MKETKDNNQKLYKIRIYKDFEFPSFSIDKNNKLSDLYFKSLEEIEENFRKDNNYFNLEITQILPFKFENNPEHKLDNNNYNFFIREIAMYDLVTEYGELDSNKNPEIFSKSGVLKSEVEKYYSDKVKHYYSILENKII